MIEKKKLLIATSNQGKFEEIKQFLYDLPFELVNLKDLDKKIPEPEETEPTIESNAILKAKYYAEQTGLISLADDGGLFIDALDGWPGVKSARVSDTDDARVETVLEKMKDKKNRGASFQVSLALYDPEKNKLFVSSGKTDGKILEEAFRGGINNYGFNPIFYITDIGKVYAEMTLQEKNSVSHRGKALLKIKYYLQHEYGSRNIVVPLALIIKDGKILSSVRNDPHRPKYHKKWEFPGGSVEIGEEIHENLIREVKEETGFEVEVVKMLQNIYVKYQEDLQYQVYLIPHVCKIVGGEEKFNDAEVLDMKFFEIDSLTDMPLIGENKEMYKKLLPELKEVIQKYNL